MSIMVAKSGDEKKDADAHREDGVKEFKAEAERRGLRVPEAEKGKEEWTGEKAIEVTDVGSVLRVEGPVEPDEDNDDR